MELVLSQLQTLGFECYRFGKICSKIEQIRFKYILPVEIAYFHRWGLIENLFKFTPIWDLNLTNFSIGVKCISLISKLIASHDR